MEIYLIIRIMILDNLLCFVGLPIFSFRSEKYFYEVFSYYWEAKKKKK